MVTKIICIVLILLGIFIRLYEIDTVPSGLFADEVSIALNAKTIAQNGIDEYGKWYPFVFESFSDYKLPLYIYTTSFIFKLFGPTTISVRFVSLISSIVSIFLIGYFAYLLFSQRKYIFYFAAVTLSLSLYHIHFSRIAYESMYSTMFFLIFLICFLKALQGNYRVWSIIGGIALLFSLWSYQAVRFIIPFFVVTMMLFARKADIPKKNLWNIRYACVIFAIFIVFAFIPNVLNPKVDQRPISYVSLTNQTSENFFQKLFQMGSSYLWNYNLEFLFRKGDEFAYRHGTRESGAFLLLFIVPFSIGLFQFIKQFSLRNYSFVFLGVLLVLCGIPSALTAHVPYGPRILPFIIPLSILISLGISYIYEFLNKKTTIVKFEIISIMLFTLMYQVLWFSHIYFVHYKKKSLSEFPLAQREMSYYIGSLIQKDPERVIYFLGQRSCRQWSHDELHLWYFADLPNEPMITWNKMFQAERYKWGSAFDAYDAIKIPRGTISNLVLFPGEYSNIEHAKQNSIIVRCGIHLNDIKSDEKILKIFYMYEDEKRDPYYVVSQKL